MPAATVAGIFSRVTADQIKYLVVGFELLLQGGGVALLIWLLIDPKRRASLRQSRLPAWNIPLSEFLLFLALILLGWFVFSLVASLLITASDAKGDLAMILRITSSQLGMLAGYFAFSPRRGEFAKAEGLPPPTATDAPGVIKSGLATFLIVLIVVVAAAALWQGGLKLFGVPLERQDLIGMFRKAESPWTVAIMIAMAGIIAPVTEELVFRAGVYRFLRTRMHPALAALLPALIFAGLHVNWETLAGYYTLLPLVALAVFFSFAYQYTGRISTVIIAHALFNLNTMLALFSGATGD